jgi:hypothetical protein
MASSDLSGDSTRTEDAARHVILSAGRSLARAQKWADCVLVAGFACYLAYVLRVPGVLALLTLSPGFFIGYVILSLFSWSALIPAAATLAAIMIRLIASRRARERALAAAAAVPSGGLPLVLAPLQADRRAAVREVARLALSAAAVPPASVSASEGGADADGDDADAVSIHRDARRVPGLREQELRPGAPPEHGAGPVANTGSRSVGGPAP